MFRDASFLELSFLITGLRFMIAKGNESFGAVTTATREALPSDEASA